MARVRVSKHSEGVHPVPVPIEAGGTALPVFTSWFDLALMLVMGHFLADFALQHDRMAVEKCPGERAVLPWGWWLSAHAATHGFLVAWITGLPLLGLAEWLLHGVIDLGKCRGYYRLNIDQTLHLLCKFLWVALVFRGLPHSGLTP
jgi:hypothetical protein